jgi:hypothetical protein
MRTWKPTFHSLPGFICRAPAPPVPVPSPLARIQQAMVSTLGAERRFADIVHRIEAGADLQTLWYLRADMMVALAAQQGEEQARHLMNQVSHQFEGLLPPGFVSRHSPLGNR